MYIFPRAEIFACFSLQLLAALRLAVGFPLQSGLGRRSNQAADLQNVATIVT